MVPSSLTCFPISWSMQSRATLVLPAPVGAHNNRFSSDSMQACNTRMIQFFNSLHYCQFFCRRLYLGEERHAQYLIHSSIQNKSPIRVYHSYERKIIKLVQLRRQNQNIFAAKRFERYIHLKRPFYELEISNSLWCNILPNHNLEETKMPVLLTLKSLDWILLSALKPSKAGWA